MEAEEPVVRGSQLARYLGGSAFRTNGSAAQRVACAAVASVSFARRMVEAALVFFVRHAARVRKQGMGALIGVFFGRICARILQARLFAFIIEAGTR